MAQPVASGVIVNYIKEPSQALDEEPRICSGHGKSRRSKVFLRSENQNRKNHKINPIN